MFSITNIVALGCLQGGLLSLYLIFKPKVAALLGLFLALITANMCVGFYLNSGLFEPEMHWVALWNSINTYWLLGPLLLSFVITITQPSRKLKPKEVLHLTPFLISLITALIIWSTQQPSEYTWYISELMRWANMPLIERFSPKFLLPALHFTTYLLIASWLTLNYWKNTGTEAITPQLSWICLALITSYLMMLSMLGVLVVALILTIPPSATLFAIANLTTVTGLFAASLLLARFGPPQSFNPLQSRDQKDSATGDKMDAIPHTKPKQVVNAEQQGQLLKLEKLMTQHEYFKSSELTQLKLAEYMGISRHQLSELLSLHSSGNFYEFLNKFRIEAVKSEIINQPVNTNLLNLAYDCGFNSKSSFINAFKKFEGLTPSQYRKQVKSNS